MNELDRNRIDRIRGAFPQWLDEPAPTTDLNFNLLRRSCWYASAEVAEAIDMAEGRHNWHWNIPKQAGVCGRCGMHLKPHPDSNRHNTRYWCYADSADGTYGDPVGRVPVCTQDSEHPEVYKA